MNLDRPMAPDPYALLPVVPTFVLTSNDISDGKPMDQKFAHKSAGGQNISPHLAWAGFPADVAGFAVTCLDPDAPTGSGFWHWQLLNLPPSVTELPTGGPLPGGAFCTRNDFGEQEYGGPAPPAGDIPHRYVFVVHALSTPQLPVTPDAPAGQVGFQLTFHTLARAIIRPTYQIPA